LFARFVTNTGHSGYGETLPRPYVTGEERGTTFDLLAECILPRLLELEFSSFPEVCEFLANCDGQAPGEWVDAAVPQTAAWCLVDLGLLDTFSRAFGADPGKELTPGAGANSDIWPDPLRFSVVVSGEGGRGALRTLLKTRAFGIRDVKVKVEDADSLAGVRLARRLLGQRA